MVQFTSTKTKMFHGSPSIAPLHFDLQMSNVKIKNVKIAKKNKSFFWLQVRRKWSDLL